MLILLISLAWLLYPIVGVIGVARAIAEGTRPADAGFSCMPELLVFPPAFLGVAMTIDYFALPFGRWTVGVICGLMIIYGIVVSIWNLFIIRRIKKTHLN